MTALMGATGVSFSSPEVAIVQPHVHFTRAADGVADEMNIEIEVEHDVRRCFIAAEGYGTVTRIIEPAENDRSSTSLPCLKCTPNITMPESGMIASRQHNGRHRITRYAGSGSGRLGLSPSAATEMLEVSGDITLLYQAGIRVMTSTSMPADLKTPPKIRSRAAYRYRILQRR